jgi:Domain of unknown function (DUF5666)
MKHPSRKRTLRKVGLTSAIAVTVFASGIGVASASTHPSKPVSPPAARGSKDAGVTPPAPMLARGPFGIGGDVTALTSSSITIATQSSSVTYSLNASTTVTDLRPGAKSEGLSLGENVRVVPSSSDSSVAASITIVPAAVGGRVSAINGDTITVTDPNAATVTIQVNATTTFTKSGAHASITDVRVGSFIFATGAYGSSPTALDAATVGIGSPPPGAPGPPRNARGPGPLAGPFAGGLPDIPAPSPASLRGAIRK